MTDSETLIVSVLAINAFCAAFVAGLYVFVCPERFMGEN